MRLSSYSLFVYNMLITLFIPAQPRACFTLVFRCVKKYAWTVDSNTLWAVAHTSCMVLLHLKASGLYNLACTDSVLHQQQAPCAPQEGRQTSLGKQVVRRTSSACHGIVVLSLRKLWAVLLLRLAGMGIPLVPLGCIIIPLLPCLLLLRYRRQLDTPHVKRRWGFLYCNYRSVSPAAAAVSVATSLLLSSASSRQQRLYSQHSDATPMPL